MATQREWLKSARRPEYLGSNARMRLKELGGRFWLSRPLAPMMFHIAIGMRSVDVKHDLLSLYAPQIRQRRLAA